MQNDVEILLDLVESSSKAFTKKVLYKKYVDNLLSQGLPPIFSFIHLADLLGTDPVDLHGLAFQTHLYYKKFSIPKRSGGERQIIAPHSTLDLIQRWIGENILQPSFNVFPDCVVGYRTNKSILDHVEPHTTSICLMKFDLKDFFPSIRSKFVADIFIQLGYSRAVSKTLTALITFNGSLPQGASTSPLVSNIFLRDFDHQFYQYCAERNYIYTRYVDDIVISGNEELASNLQEIKKMFVSNRLTLNHKKTRIYKSVEKVRFITGLIIKDNEIRLPKAMRRKIRVQCHLFLNDLKRLASNDMPKTSAMINESWKEKDLVLDPIFAERILGKLNYWLHIEPANVYANKMRDTIRSALQALEI